MQRFRLKGVTTPEQPHGRQHKYPKDHITLLLDQVGGYGTALQIEFPEGGGSSAWEQSQRREQANRALALWRILRPMAHRRTYVDVYPVSSETVDLEVWSTSYGGACNLGDDFSFHARFEGVRLSWPCVLSPTHSLEAVAFVESRWNRLHDDAPHAPHINVWRNAAD